MHEPVARPFSCTDGSTTSQTDCCGTWAAGSRPTRDRLSASAARARADRNRLRYHEVADGEDAGRCSDGRHDDREHIAGRDAHEAGDHDDDESPAHTGSEVSDHLIVVEATGELSGQI